MQRIHKDVSTVIEESNEKYKANANQNRRSKEFFEGDQGVIYLQKDRYPKEAYHKLKSKKIGPCMILKKISSNAYLVELQENIQIQSYV